MKNPQSYSEMLDFFNNFAMGWKVPYRGSGCDHMTKENSKFPVFWYADEIPTEKELQSVTYIGRSIKIYNSTLINHYGFFTSWDLIRAIEYSDRKRRNKEFNQFHHFDHQHTSFEGLYYIFDKKKWVVSWA